MLWARANCRADIQAPGGKRRPPRTLAVQGQDLTTYVVERLWHSSTVLPREPAGPHWRSECISCFQWLRVSPPSTWELRAVPVEVLS